MVHSHLPSFANTIIITSRAMIGSSLSHAVVFFIVLFFMLTRLLSRGDIFAVLFFFFDSLKKKRNNFIFSIYQLHLRNTCGCFST